MSDTALIIAGGIGCFVAIVHGIALQKMFIGPIRELSAAGKPLRAPVLRLVGPLLHFTTLCWFIGGVALIAAPFAFDQSGRMATALVVGGFYSFGAVGNLWATRGRHPGWVLLAVAVVLIIYGT